ncbi:MAG: hypothetical protein GW870_02600 [Deltaproteobacteria bacterium]|nr:hypothetical protein [Deltaproteobacteria bacterium]NCP96714.1 hypothetical protein [Deltaproteobacteria bacterium]
MTPRRPQQVDITSRLARRKTVPVKLGALPLLAVGAVALVFFFAIWQSTQMVTAVQTIDALAHQQVELERRNDQLRLKLAALASLGEAEPWARSRGFRTVAEGQVVRVQPHP